MSVLLRVLPLVAAVAGLLLPAGAQVPVKGGEVSDFDFAVGVVERAYAGYPDKTANRAAEYGALKERLRSGMLRGATRMTPLPSISLVRRFAPRNGGREGLPAQINPPTFGLRGTDGAL